MIRIIEIERRGTIWTIRFDDAPQLRCSRAFARRLRLNTGQHIDAALLQRVRESAAADLADQLAERMLRSPRSRREIAARLLREGVPETAVRSALEQLEQRGGHDEDDDALALARRCVRQAGPDWNEVRQKCGRRLRRRGFSAATALRAVQLAWQETQQPQQSPCQPQCAPNDIEPAPVASAKFQSRLP